MKKQEITAEIEQLHVFENNSVNEPYLKVTVRLRSRLQHLWPGKISLNIDYSAPIEFDVDKARNGFFEKLMDTLNKAEKHIFVSNAVVVKEHKRIQEVLSTPINQIECSLKIQKILTSTGRENLADIVSSDIVDLLRTRNIGKQYFTIIESIVYKKGLHFGFPVENYGFKKQDY